MDSKEKFNRIFSLVTVLTIGFFVSIFLYESGSLQLSLLFVVLGLVGLVVTEHKNFPEANFILTVSALVGTFSFFLLFVDSYGYGDYYDVSAVASLMLFASLVVWYFNKPNKQNSGIVITAFVLACIAVLLFIVSTSIAIDEYNGSVLAWLAFIIALSTGAFAAVRFVSYVYYQRNNNLAHDKNQEVTPEIMLEKLSQLKMQGVITEEEYSEKRKQYLEEL